MLTCVKTIKNFDAANALIDTCLTESTFLEVLNVSSSIGLCDMTCQYYRPVMRVFFRFLQTPLCFNSSCSDWSYLCRSIGSVAGIEDVIQYSALHLLLRQTFTVGYWERNKECCSQQSSCSSTVTEGFHADTDALILLVRSINVYYFMLVCAGIGNG